MSNSIKKKEVGVTKNKSLSEVEKLSNNKTNYEEQLLYCVQYILKINGIEKSFSSIRDVADVTQEKFSFRDAISTFRNLNFSSNLGTMKIEKITTGHCPCIVILENKNLGILAKIKNNKEYEVIRVLNGKLEKKIYDFDVLKKIYSDEIILIKPPNVQKEQLKKQKINWFWGSIFLNKWTYFQVLIAAAVSNFLGLSTSIFIMVVYDRVVPNAAIESLVALTIGVVLALGFDFIIKTLRASFIDKAGKVADSRMSKLIFEQLIAMNLASKNARAGAMASTVREFETLRDFFTSATLVAVVDLPFVFLFIYVCYLIGGPLAYVPLVCVPIVILMGLIIQPFLAKISSDSMETGMNKQGILVETLTGLETIKATGSTGLMKKRFIEATSSQSDLGLRSRMFSAFAINGAVSVQQFAQIAIIFYGVFLIRDGVISMGALIAVVILSGRTLAPLGALAQSLTRANSARSAYKSINNIMSKPQDKSSIENPISRPVLKGNLEFKNVTFQYPGASQPTLNSLSFKINSGEKVAILGKMGSGKSTIARILSGLYVPDSGSVLIDGIDIRQIDQADLRKNMGFMLQDTWLFSGTVKENIQMGYVEYNDEHILKISKISGVDDFVRHHPLGYDFVLKERGEGLSGGQRQSINLARALIHDPPTLILDEPTSSMDLQTENIVLDNLSDWVSDKTLIAITHRNSVVKLATRVLILDQGVLVADDEPSKLLNKK